MSKLLYTLAALTVFVFTAVAQPVCDFSNTSNTPSLGWFDDSGNPYTTFTTGSQNWEIYTSGIASPSSLPPQPYVLHTNPGNGNGSQSPEWLTSQPITGFNWTYNKLHWSFWMGRGQGVGQNGGNNDGSVVWLYVNSHTTIDLINTPGLEGIKCMWHHSATTDNFRLSEVHNGVETVIKDIILIENLNLYEWGVGVYVERIPGGQPNGSQVTYKVWLSTPESTNPNYASSSVPADYDVATLPNNGYLRINETSLTPWTPSSTTGYIGVYSYYAVSRKDAAEYNQICFQDDGPTPVELTTFKADYRNDVVNLNWRTETEVNNYGFEIQRSIEHNGDWQTVGFVEGNGTTNSPRDYSYTDVPNADGASMIAYRLKQIDRDGSYEYSNTVLVSIAPKSTDVLYNFPNPFNPTTRITFTLLQNDVVTLNVFNTAGEKVAELYNNAPMNAGYHTASFNGTNLPSGRYFYRLTTSAGTKTNSMVLSK